MRSFTNHTLSEVSDVTSQPGVVGLGDLVLSLSSRWRSSAAVVRGAVGEQRGVALRDLGVNIIEMRTPEVTNTPFECNIDFHAVTFINQHDDSNLQS